MSPAARPAGASFPRRGAESPPWPPGAGDMRGGRGRRPPPNRRQTAVSGAKAGANAAPRPPQQPRNKTTTPRRECNKRQPDNGT